MTENIFQTIEIPTLKMCSGQLTENIFSLPKNIPKIIQNVNLELF